MKNSDLFSRAMDHANTYLSELNEHSINPTVSIRELRQRLDRPMGETAVSDEQILDELVEDTRGGLMASTGGRFFGWVIGGALPVAVAADWLTTVWDQNAASSACSPAMAVVEEICGAWLREILRLP